MHEGGQLTQEQQPDQDFGCGATIGCSFDRIHSSIRRHRWNLMCLHLLSSRR